MEDIDPTFPPGETLLGYMRAASYFAADPESDIDSIFRIERALGVSFE
jgi:hypothetical protein